MKLDCAHVAINKIDNHAINPANRILSVSDLTNDKLLRKGILTNPLKVYENEDGQYTLLDGHRRKAAIESLIRSKILAEGIEVNCVVYRLDDNDDPETLLPDIYASLNTAIKHRGDEKAAIYRKPGGEKFLTERDQKSYKDAIEFLGETAFDTCVDARIDPARNKALLERVVKRMGHDFNEVTEGNKARVLAWFFGPQKIQTNSLRTFEVMWSLAKDELGRPSRGKQTVAVLTLEYAINNGKDFDPNDQSTLLDPHYERAESLRAESLNRVPVEVIR